MSDYITVPELKYLSNLVSVLNAYPEYAFVPEAS